MGWVQWVIRYYAPALIDYLNFRFFYFQMLCKYLNNTFRQQWSNESIKLAEDATKKGQTIVRFHKTKQERYIRKHKNDPNYVADKELELVAY